MDCNPAAANGQNPFAIWQMFLERALEKRLEFDKFEHSLAFQPYLDPVLVATLALKPPERSVGYVDPRTPKYIDILLKHDLVDAASLVRALYLYSPLHGHLERDQEHHAQHVTNGQPHGAGEAKGKGKQQVVRWKSSRNLEDVLFFRVNRLITIEGGLKSAREVSILLRLTSKWMKLFADAAAAFARDFGAIHSPQAKHDLESSCNAFTHFFIGFTDATVTRTTLSRKATKDQKKEVSDAMEVFLQSIMQNLLPNLSQSLSQNFATFTNHLELFRSQHLAVPDPVEKRASGDAEMDNYMDLIGMDSLQIQDIPAVNSRAGLYIYLNAALVGRPLIEDQALYTYLQNRYQHDLQTCAIQLILASFDVVANAIFRNESRKNGHLFKSYLVNKVPLILRSLAASSTLYAFDAEFCITQALNQVDKNIFPTLANMFDMSNTGSSFQDSIRQDFCFACQLHGLITGAAIESLLGDITYQTLPDEGCLTKETLVQQCVEDPEKAQKLVGDLEKMDGNVGAVAQALMEVVSHLCRNNDTMALKIICRQLACKPLSLDVLLLFDQPAKILHPICDLLDNWRYDEDQGEYQPVYEEFGSILLLLLAFVYRYNLSTTDLSLRSADSFVAKFITRSGADKTWEGMTDQEQKNLDGWIRGLFCENAGGLADDLMSTCLPQDFYLLIPALFDAIVVASSVEAISEEILKSGMEYLVDAFLLPSMVSALLSLAIMLRSDRQPAQKKAIIRLLQLIMLPNQISHEASSILFSVLNIVAKDLEHALRSYQRQEPKSQDIEPLLRALKDNIPLSRRTGGADHNELESWTSTQGGGLSTAVHNTISNLSQWDQSQQAVNGMPVAYTHRQILVALKILGAKRVLSIILDELKQQTQVANGSNASNALDVATALVCAPDVTNCAPILPLAGQTNPVTGLPDETVTPPFVPRQRRINLREALKAEAGEWKKLQKIDTVSVQTVVRLYRRVEAQMVLPPPPPPAMLQPGELALAGVTAQDTSLDDAIAAAAAAAGTDTSVADAMDLDVATSGLDLGLAGAGDLSALSAGADLGGGDFFSDLGSGGNFSATDFDWDMELA